MNLGLDSNFETEGNHLEDYCDEHSAKKEQQLKRLNVDLFNESDHSDEEN
jgi:hypothetical protein